MKLEQEIQDEPTASTVIFTLDRNSVEVMPAAQNQDANDSKHSVKGREPWSHSG